MNERVVLNNDGISIDVDAGDAGDLVAKILAEARRVSVAGDPSAAISGVLSMVPSGLALVEGEGAPSLVIQMGAARIAVAITDPLGLGSALLAVSADKNGRN